MSALYVPGHLLNAKDPVVSKTHNSRSPQGFSKDERHWTCNKPNNFGYYQRGVEAGGPTNLGDEGRLPCGIFSRGLSRSEPGPKRRAVKGSGLGEKHVGRPWGESPLEELKEVELQGERHLVRLKWGRTLREKELYLLALPLPPTRCPSEYTLPPSAYPRCSLFRNATAFSPLEQRKIIDQKEKASELSQLCGLAINLDCCLEKPKNLPFLCFLLPIPPPAAALFLYPCKIFSI